MTNRAGESHQTFNLNSRPNQWLFQHTIHCGHTDKILCYFCITEVYKFMTHIIETLTASKFINFQTLHQMQRSTRFLFLCQLEQQSRWHCLHELMMAVRYSFRQHDAALIHIQHRREIIQMFTHISFLPTNSISIIMKNMRFKHIKQLNKKNRI